jgi:hypothetical protein
MGLMSGRCDWCGETDYPVDLLEAWPDERAWMFDVCCEGRHEALVELLNEALELPPASRARVLAPLRALFEGYGIPFRSLFSDGVGGMRWEEGADVVPVEWQTARAFVERHHRHAQAPRGWRSGFGARCGGQLVGVVTVGRPVARLIDSATTVEVNRLCVDPTLDPTLVWNVASQLYAAAAREARRRGYGRIITYTLETEQGTTLRAAGWTPVARTRGGAWTRPSRARTDAAPTCRKVRWERAL